MDRGVIGIGRRLREVRGERTLPKFADTFGVHKNSIARWEAETQFPNALVLFAICRTESISATWLLTGEGEKSRQYEFDGRDLLRLATAARRNAPAFGYCAGCGEPMALDQEGLGLCPACEAESTPAPAWSGPHGGA